MMKLIAVMFYCTYEGERCVLFHAHHPIVVNSLHPASIRAAIHKKYPMCTKIHKVKYGRVLDENNHQIGKRNTGVIKVLPTDSDGSTTHAVEIGKVILFFNNMHRNFPVENE